MQYDKFMLKMLYPNNPSRFGIKAYPCPGNIPHRVWSRRNNKHLSMKMFDRYVQRGHKKYQLYWRLHPQAMIEVANRKW